MIVNCFATGAVVGAAGSVFLSPLLGHEMMVGLLAAVPVTVALMSVGDIRAYVGWLLVASVCVVVIAVGGQGDDMAGVVTPLIAVAWAMGVLFGVLIHVALRRNRLATVAALRAAHRGRMVRAVALRQLRAAEAIGRRLSEGGPTAETLDEVMRLLEEESGYRYPSIYIGDDTVMVLGAQRNQASLPHRLVRGDGLAGRVMQTHAAELVDVEREPGAMDVAGPAVRSGLCVPLVAAGRLLGILAVQSERMLGRDDLASMSILADRIAAALALAQRHSALQKVLEASPLPTVVFNPDDTISFWNEAATEVFGWTAAEVLGRPTPLLPPDDEPTVHWAAAVASGQRVNGRELVRVHKSGRLVPVRVFATRYGDHEPYGVIGLYQDLSAERAAESALAESTTRFDAVVGALREGVLVQAPDGRVIWTNPAAERLLAKTAQGLDGRFTHDPTVRLLRKDGAPLPAEEHPGIRAFRSGRPVLQTVIGVMPAPQHGTDDAGAAAVEEPVWLEVDSIPLRRTPDEAPYAVVSSLSDVTERMRYEAELRLAARRVSSVLEQTSDGIVGVSLDGIITFVNRAAADTFGYMPDELIGRPVEVLIPTALAPGHASLRSDFVRTPSIRSSGSGRHVAGLRKDGTSFPADVALSPVEMPTGLEIYATITDITDRLRIDAELLQAAKMDSIGRLAGGIAHDFNNLLTAIMGYGDAVRTTLPAESAALKDMDQVLMAAGRAAQLTRQLLGFARKTVLDPGVEELNGIVRDLEPLLGRLLGEQVALVTRLEPSAGHVRVDRSQMDQVLVNLAINARDAMPRGGSLVLETASVPAAGQEGFERLEPGAVLAMIRVTDTGVGMSDEVLRNVFEPFFTTKPFGEGTGLGLATTYGIITQSGGTITATSQQGKGSVFTILLPAVAGDMAPGVAGPPGADRMIPGHGTVLLVEDEESVRSLIARMLERRGYHVLQAPNGASALELTRDSLSTVDLLLTDVVMPGMRGPELADRIRARRPDLPVVFMSGYLGDGDEEPTLDGSPMLRKPFQTDQLVSTIAACMSGAGSPARR